MMATTKQQLTKRINLQLDITKKLYMESLKYLRIELKTMTEEKLQDALNLFVKVNSVTAECQQQLKIKHLKPKTKKQLKLRADLSKLHSENTIQMLKPNKQLKPKTK
jgi:hypothetical protein